MSSLNSVDPQIAELIKAEERRQADTVKLIASENYASKAVLEATGTVLTNKYSEGYPGKRYYEGQQVIDQIETLAIERAKSLFGVNHANVQPYSGSPANLADLPGLPEAGRHRHGHGPAVRRPPDPRLVASRPPASGSTRSATACARTPAASTWTRSASSRCASGPS